MHKNKKKNNRRKVYMKKLNYVTIIDVIINYLIRIKRFYRIINVMYRQESS